MIRKASISSLLPEKREQYIQMHSNPPEEVLKIMSEHHHTNHTVFLYGNKLFQYFDYTGDDFENDMEEMRQLPVMQQWWAQCRACVAPFDEDAVSTWTQLPEIFHND